MSIENYTDLGAAQISAGVRAGEFTPTEVIRSAFKRAKEIGKTLQSLPYIDEMLPVDTNMIVFRLKENKPLNDFLNHLLKNDIKAVPFGKQTIRMVTHLHITDDDVETLRKVLTSFK